MSKLEPVPVRPGRDPCCHRIAGALKRLRVPLLSCGFNSPPGFWPVLARVLTSAARWGTYTPSSVRVKPTEMREFDHRLHRAAFSEDRVTAARYESRADTRPYMSSLPSLLAAHWSISLPMDRIAIPLCVLDLRKIEGHCRSASRNHPHEIAARVINCSRSCGISEARRRGGHIVKLRRATLDDAEPMAGSM